MRSVRASALAVAFLLVAGPAAAQQQVHVMRESVLRAATVEDQAKVDKVREDLAKVRLAEEAYFTANQTYAPELSDLKGLKLSQGTNVIILMSGPMGFKAEATNFSLKGAEVVHVMRMEKGEKCPMMEHGGTGGMQGMDGMKGMGQGGPAPATGAPQHQH
jgi:L-arabinose isomerase